ncbi:3'-5' exonuclease domain containing protein [Plasmodium cynomolgi strain B]|uniref:3'-5' exonuclease domain containing protein n=1 Tax=Plasmodium cynomolgi (strain B) TaxID=1120755 RepID=K6UXF5_PLACD|nr:3'-5' exonuclease domain containing protein [Plasmodium cynomolgi strain B]GAB67160.1 3'-5' exonuclease domain containing protein [Plasmodium cynomolgi strain B]
MQKWGIKLKAKRQHPFCVIRYDGGILPQYLLSRGRSTPEVNRKMSSPFRCDECVILHVYDDCFDGLRNGEKKYLKNAVGNPFMRTNFSLLSSKQRCSHCYSTNNKVYVKGEIYDVLPTLCKSKEIEAIAANLIFFILKFVNLKNAESAEEYKDKIKNVYANLIRCYHKIFTDKGRHGECIFCIFNDEVVKYVSPSLRKNKKNIIQELVLNSLCFFFKNNARLKDKLDPNLMCEIIKYKKFLYILDCLSFDRHLLREAMTARHVDYLFSSFLNDRVHLCQAISLASFFLSDDDGHIGFSSPFKEESAYNCRILLKYILQAQSKNCLFLFLDGLKCDDLKMDVYRWLTSVDEASGFFSDYWGYLAAREYLLRRKEREKGEVKGSPPSEGTLIEGGQDRNYVTWEKKSLHAHRDYYELPEEMKNISMITNVESLNRMIGTIKYSQEKYWKDSIYNDNSMYTSESCGDIITAEDINNHLRGKKKKYYIGIDVEWNRNEKASIISVATVDHIYLIDLLTVDYNYKILIQSFFKWLLENPFVCKLFYNFACDMRILNSFFQGVSILCTYVNVTDLKDPVFLHQQNGVTPDSPDSPDRVISAELFNRNIIETNDIELFKKVTTSSFRDFNGRVKHGDCNHFEGTISVCSGRTTDRVHFKSLSHLCQKFLGKNLNKKLQLSNWSRRPLMESQIHYAATDAYVLIVLERLLIENNYSSTCSSNSSSLSDVFVQKYKCRNCSWE